MGTQSPGPHRPLEEQLPQLLRGLWRAASRLARADDELPPLPEAQIEVLRVLAARGPMSPAQLAGALRLARPTVSNLIRAMTAHGLVSRWRSDTDGRAVLLSLSAEAEAMMDSVRRRRTQAFARALAGLPARARDQLDVALPALRQLQQAMETAADAAASQGPAPR
jgi:DNA-binding MarR family transcriptional regulator